MLRQLKENMIAWLDQQLTAKRDQLQSAPMAVIDPTAVMLPEAIIENLAGKPEAITIGPESRIRGRLLTYANAGCIRIGSWCYVGARSEIWSMASVTIGDRVLISHHVNIIDNSGHSKDPRQRHLHFRQIVTTGAPRTWEQLPGITAAPIVIEDDVWINCGVIILAGVRIGARSIIAAGSIVTKDIPPDTLYRCAITPVTKSLLFQEHDADL